MSHQQERYRYGIMPASEDAPHQVLYEKEHYLSSVFSHVSLRCFSASCHRATRDNEGKQQYCSHLSYISVCLPPLLNSIPNRHQIGLDCRCEFCTKLVAFLKCSVLISSTTCYSWTRNRCRWTSSPNLWASWACTVSNKGGSGDSEGCQSFFGYFSIYWEFHMWNKPQIFKLILLSNIDFSC